MGSLAAAQRLPLHVMEEGSPRCQSRWVTGCGSVPRLVRSIHPRTLARRAWC